MVSLDELKVGIEGSIVDLNKEIAALEELLNNTEANRQKLLQYLGRRDAFQLTLNTIVQDNESSDTNNTSETSVDSTDSSVTDTSGSSDRSRKRSKRIAKSAKKSTN